ncbi:hypothetical protein BE08_35055 [Sorangium cellulosum]|uniref:Prolipoprotein diacylglyceryl transferase n=1 Tax=Sorangium cellulosum TaxID=56 RepID=A0A150P0G0_SORCE|nr:hypothetical protein BE08_35055 [Sorangium cellulosum]
MIERAGAAVPALPNAAAAPGQRGDALASCARPSIGRLGWNSYQVCGVIGYLVALTLVMALAARAGIGPAGRLALAVAPPAAFLLLARCTSLVFGGERIVFYESALAACGAAVLGLWAVGADVRAGTDLAVLGVGTFLCFGRVGCFRVACCHGRPARWGVRYGEAHARAGLSPRWVGPVLFPIQLVDGALSGALVLAGVACLLGGAPALAPTALYVCGYGLGRFAIEFARGDDARAYALGVSEAQWTALGTSWAAAALRPAAATVAAAAALTIAVLALVVARRKGLLASLWLTQARHLVEVESAFRRLRSGEAKGVVSTGEGLCVSMQPLEGASPLLDFILSRPGGRRPLSPRTARRIAAHLGRGWTVRAVLPGRTPGLIHVVVDG